MGDEALALMRALKYDCDCNRDFANWQRVLSINGSDLQSEGCTIVGVKGSWKKSSTLNLT